MELKHDVMFKRNIHGYVEEANVRVWYTNIRQVPMWVVHHPHNQEQGPQDAMAYGLHFLDMNNVVKHIERFYDAFQKDSEFIISRDLCDDVIHALRTAEPDPDGIMYRVIYHNPMAEYPVSAIGPGRHLPDEPRFVNPVAFTTGPWCIYNRNVALAVATMNASNLYGGHIHDIIRDNPPGGTFSVQATPFNASGIPKEGEQWTIVEDLPQWNRNVRLEFSQDLSRIDMVMERNRYE